VTTGSRSRIIQYNLVTRQPEKEYLYNTDAVAKAPIPPTGASDSGLVDLLAIDDFGTFLALERSFAVGQGNTIKIYEVKLQGATDISKIESLTSLTATQLQAIAPAQKRLLINLDGFNDNVFTGSGNDSVDVPIAGANAGNNRIDLGSGNDVIYVANGDRSFGSTGDDIFEANDAKDYRISAGAGNDTLFLGTNGRALGGDGNDKLFVGNGGGNYLSGGAGADQFWIANVEIPGAANTIVDFQIGTDVIGIQGATSLGINATSLKLNQVGADTAINFGSQTLAVLTGMQASNLTLGNPSQFVFA
jgi:Ca2+-binding RTX toxin-like protein